MGSFSGLGIGLSFVFGFILMGLVAELYYLLWWKKRITNTSSSSSTSEIMEFSFLYCWKKPVSSSFNSSRSTNQLTSNSQQDDLESGNSSKDLMSSSKGYGEGGVENELMRMHNLCGPPRFLFTIKEESKEDLESDDGKSRSSRKGSKTSKSLSEILLPIDGTIGTPFLTPMSSPNMKNSPHSLDNYNSHGFNPLFESISESELNRLRSSPPPKFKFLKDAEDKLIKRMLVEEAEKKSVKVGIEEGEKEVSFGKFLNAKSFVREQVHNQATQVLPLASSPTFNQIFN